jgi:hypothetical protein
MKQSNQFCRQDNRLNTKGVVLQIFQIMKITVFWDVKRCSLAELATSTLQTDAADSPETMVSSYQTTRITFQKIFTSKYVT